MVGFFPGVLAHLSVSLYSSSVASSRSMPGVVGRFVLPVLSLPSGSPWSPHLLSLGRPVPSCRLPPWDLSLVFSLLRGPPSEPLSSGSLFGPPRQVLFLLLLASSRWVGELQALSLPVSSLGFTLFPLSLSGFRTKPQPSVRPLPRSFLLRPLQDFVGSLLAELLLCPFRALRLCFSYAAAFPSCPRSLFVSPRSPSLSLSLHSFSFFFCDVMAGALSSASRSLPSAPCSSYSTVPSFSSSRPRASLSACGGAWVCGVLVFLRSAPLASVLVAPS